MPARQSLLNSRQGNLRLLFGFNHDQNFWFNERVQGSPPSVHTAFEARTADRHCPIVIGSAVAVTRVVVVRAAVSRATTITLASHVGSSVGAVWADRCGSAIVVYATRPNVSVANMGCTPGLCLRRR